MNGQGIAQILVYAVVLIALGYPLGFWMAPRLHGERLPLAALERGFLRLGRAAVASRTGRATRKTVLSSASPSSSCSTCSSACRAISS